MPLIQKQYEDIYDIMDDIQKRISHIQDTSQRALASEKAEEIVKLLAENAQLYQTMKPERRLWKKLPVSWQSLLTLTGACLINVSQVAFFERFKKEENLSDDMKMDVLVFFKLFLPTVSSFISVGLHWYTNWRLQDVVPPLAYVTQVDIQHIMGNKRLSVLNKLNMIHDLLTQENKVLQQCKEAKMEDTVMSQLSNVVSSYNCGFFKLGMIATIAETIGTHVTLCSLHSSKSRYLDKLEQLENLFKEPIAEVLPIPCGSNF